GFLRNAGTSRHRVGGWSANQGPPSGRRHIRSEIPAPSATTHAARRRWPPSGRLAAEGCNSSARSGESRENRELTRPGGFPAGPAADHACGPGSKEAELGSLRSLRDEGGKELFSSPLLFGSGVHPR